MKYTVTTHEADGTVTTTEHEASPEMAQIMAEFQAWEGWCRCGAPETGEIIPRGHSVDVMCANCGGAIQIG